MRTWLEYAGAGLLLTVAGAGLATRFVDAAAARAVWFAAGLAYVVQLIAFGALLAVRQRHSVFLIGWLAGLVLRFGVVFGAAFVVTRSGALPTEPTLLSLVAFLFVLLMLEPVFLRRGLQTR